ncbi:hypothetical protein AB2B38_013515 [Balneola sp. MJW-20]|uniref:hypothetical protein n=1 Tax=Gracilimonas aurantiaca TaxID=3234185 RepID=UPI0034653A5F
MKLKTCHTCGKETAIAYRIQIQKGKEWIFVCPDCIENHKEGEFYRYGGTWKGSRH